MHVDDEWLWGRYLLAAYEESVGVEVPIIDGYLPFLGPQIRRLRLAVSPQTGGCESDRDSPLRERLPRHEQYPDDDGQHRDEVSRPLGWKSHRVPLALWRYRAGSISASPRWMVSLVIGPGLTRRTTPAASMNTDVGTPRSA